MLSTVEMAIMNRVDMRLNCVLLWGIVSYVRTRTRFVGP